MKKTILVALFSGYATFCVVAHGAESRMSGVGAEARFGGVVLPNPLDTPNATRMRPPVLPGHAMPEVRIDASAIRQLVKEKKITPLPDAADKFHGEHRSVDDDKGSQK